MNKIKEAIVYWSDTIDATLDAIPAIEKDENGKWKFYRFGDWGCRCGIANWAYGWEQKWRPGSWVIDRPYGPNRPYEYDRDGKISYPEKVQITFLWTCLASLITWVVYRFFYKN